MKKTLLTLTAGLILCPPLITRAEVPEIDSAPNAQIEKIVETSLNDLSSKETKQSLSAGAKAEIAKYIQFLKIDPKNSKLIKNTISRLMGSSTQMLLCDNQDWACLEKKPEVTPTSEFRRDTRDDLGEAVQVSEPLSLEYWFTRAWANKLRDQPVSSETVAKKLGEKITKDGKKGVFMAIYGIDDPAASMAPVFNAVEAKVKAGVPTFGVFDVANEGDSDNFLRDYDVTVNGNSLTVNKLEDMNFSYIRPEDDSKWVWERPEWMNQLLGMDPYAVEVDVNSPTGQTALEKDVKWLMNPEKAKRSIRMAFQYKSTPALMNIMNAGIKSNEDSRARIEFPMEKIMHNKFVVLDKGGEKSVWTGTANVARTCMGDESNSNMSIYINNTEVAETFLAEFHEMFDYDKSNPKVKAADSLVTGYFHKTKRPNTKRYFRFSDGHEMRVHFAPTDDGEHRSIIPMLLSAKKGDKIRISMFGAAGLEILRALQFAASQGAKVQIVLDKVTGAGAMGWLKNKEANIFDRNPYSNDAQAIEIKLSTWLNKGLNHHKSASLSRLEGGKYRTEMLIIGSQNWSASGNDENDENMVSLRHLKKSIEAGDAFNKEFDENIWDLARTFTKADLKKSSADEDSESH